MAKTTIHSIEFLAFAYATESVDLVAQAILAILPPEIAEQDEIEFERERLTGLYNEPLYKVRLRFTKPKTAKKIIEYFARNMEEIEKRRVYRKIKTNLDTNQKKLHLRFDKDACAQGKIQLGIGSNVIKCVIKYQTYTKEHEPFLQELKDIGFYVTPNI